MKNIKILILVPNLSNPGGVSALYNVLKIDNYDNVDYFIIQGKKKLNPLFRIIELIRNYIHFLNTIRDYDVIHVNPSLSAKSFYRDGLFVFLSKVKKKKAVVYWHGWNFDFQKSIHHSKIKKLFFNKTFLNANLHIVLGSIFKNELLNLNVKPKAIAIESNAADVSFVKKDALIEKDVENVINILYISRIEEAKGIFIVLETMKLLNESGRKFNLVIAGDGSALEKAKAIVEEEKIGNVSFIGHVAGIDKSKAYENADMLLFPSYSEGMPLTIIESMFYGLVIFTRPVGGIPDWVTDKVNGFLIDSFEAAEFADAILEVTADPSLMNRISAGNKAKANDLFLPEALNKRLFNYYNELYK